DSDGDPLHPRRRRRRTSWATILIVGFLVVALGGLLLLAGGGVALWYFLSRPSATPAVTDASGGPAEKAEAAGAEPRADDKDAPKRARPRKDRPKEAPKNPGKPVRDPVEPGPPADPKPTKGKLTLLPVPEQNVKPGDQFTFNVSLRREDCKGDVALEIRGGEFGIKVNRSLVLPADVDRTTLTAEVLENAPIGKHVLTVSAKLGALNTYTAFEVLVQKPGAPVPVNPPPDAGPGPLQMLNARINVDGRVYEGHKGAVECVALSGDKKWAASGGVDGFVRLLDLD